MAPRLRVAHVTPSFHPARAYGGPPESVYQLTAHLARAGIEVRVLTTNADGAAILDISDEEFELEPLLRVRYCHRWTDHAAPGVLRRLGGLVAWADVVHLNGVYSFTTLPTLLATRIARKPLVWSSRGALQRWEGGSRLGLKRAWEEACQLMSPSRVVLHVTSPAEGAESAPRLPAAQVQVVRNGVLIPSDLPRRTLAPDGVLRLGSLGRLHPIKGLENLLQAVAHLKGDSTMRRFQLDIAGDGDTDYVRSLETLSHSLGLDSTVRFVGPRHDDAKREFFLSTDLFVAPSHRENFGIAIAEALAHGAPAVTGRGTPWSRLESEGAGYWVPNDPQSLAKTILRASSDPLLEMGGRGRDWVRAEFGWGGVARQMLEIYESLAASPPRRR